MRREPFGKIHFNSQDFLWLVRTYFAALVASY